MYGNLLLIYLIIQKVICYHWLKYCLEKTKKISRKSVICNLNSSNLQTTSHLTQNRFVTWHHRGCLGKSDGLPVKRNREGYKLCTETRQHNFSVSNSDTYFWPKIDQKCQTIKKYISNPENPKTEFWKRIIFWDKVGNTDQRDIAPFLHINLIACAYIL